MRHWIIGSVMAAVLTTMLPFDASAAEGDFVWAKCMGGTGSDRATGVALDSEGSIYTTGYFEGTADLDPGPGTFNLTVANQGVFVSKLDNTGNFIWAKAVDGTGTDWVWGIALDSAGNVYTTGSFEGTADFDPGAGTFNLTAASGDIFVWKLDSAGNFVWAKAMGGGSGDYGYNIAVDNAGNVCTTGQFSGTADFDPGPGTFNLTAASGHDIFVSKLDSAGDFVWAKGMGGTGYGIAVDSAGNTYATGYFSGTADFDPGAGTFNLTSAGGNDIFVSKLDIAGNFVWAKRVGGTGSDGGFSIAADSAGTVYTTGQFGGTVDFDPGAGTFNLTGSGGFVLTLDSAGNFVWAKAMGSGGAGIAVDSAGNAYTTGYFSGTADFDPGAGTFNLTSAGGNDIFVSKLGGTGNFVWAKAMGGMGTDQPWGIVVDSAGSIYTAGWFQGTVDFSPGVGTFNLTSAGGDDIFVSKLSGPSPNAIAISPSTTGPTSARSITFTVVFDKPVQGFDSESDVVVNLTGSAIFGTMSITGNDAVYIVTVNGISGTGTLGLAVSTTSGVEDLSGISLGTSVTSPTVTLDPSAPGLPVAAWPVGLALLAAGTAVLRKARVK